MLPRINRLQKKRDFERVFKEGKGFREDFLFLKLVKNNLKFSRFGFVVSGKVSKKAVLRNKIKRKLREAVRIKLVKIKKGFDGLLVVLTEKEIKKFPEIERIIDRLFKKAKIMK